MISLYIFLYLPCHPIIKCILLEIQLSVGSPCSINTATAAHHLRIMCILSCVVLHVHKYIPSQYSTQNALVQCLNVTVILN